MAILDLKTGKKTGEEPVVPKSFIAKEKVIPTSGIRDLKTGKLITQIPADEQVIEQPFERKSIIEDIKRASGTSIADLASDLVGAPATKMLGDFIGKAVGGYQSAGLALLGDTGKAIKSGQETEKSISDYFSPKSELAKKSVDTVFSALSQLGKIPAGWGGIADLLENQDLDSAVNTIKEVEAKGLPQYIADKNFEAYGSPLLATLTRSIPEIAYLFLAGAKGVKDVNRGRLNKARKDLDIIDQIESGGANKDLAKYRLENREAWSNPTNHEIQALAEKLNVDKAFATDLAKNMPILHKAKTFKKAASQEWDQSLLGLISGSSKHDIKVFKKQLGIYKDSLNDMTIKKTKRPIFEAGNAISEDITWLINRKNEAGKDIGEAAENMRGVKLDYAPVVDKFINTMELQGVVFNNGRPITNVRQYRNIDFRNSIYDASEGSEWIIRKQMKRLTEKDFDLDGFNLHTTKQQLSANLSIANKKGTGVEAEAKALISNLRHDINTILRDHSDEYRIANDDFSQIIKPLKDYDEFLPRKSKINFEGVNSDSAGLLTRKILTNYADAPLINKVISDLSNTVIKMGGKSTGDAAKQAMFAQSLDRRLGAFASASLEGITDKPAGVGIPTGNIDAGIKAVKSIYNKVNKVDKDRAIESMFDYLDEINKGKK